MTTEEIVLAEIRKNISEMLGADRARVEMLADTIRHGVQANGALGRFALALVGAEMAAADSD